MTKNILLISDGKIHPGLIARFWLRYSLAGLQDFNFAHAHSMEDLLSVDHDGFNSLVLFYHHKRISEAALAAFDQFVQDGGGVLAIHSTTASFKESDRFSAILGGKFAGHGPVEVFPIIPAAPPGEIFQGPEFQVLDELYLHDLQSDISVHYYTNYQGQQVPVVWTRKHGEGRVCYACPGHRAKSFRNPDYQRVIAQGLRWVSD